MFYNAAQDVDDVSCLMRDYIAIKIPKPTLEASIFADRDRARGLNHTLDMIQPKIHYQLKENQNLILRLLQYL